MAACLWLLVHFPTTLGWTTTSCKAKDCATCKCIWLRLNCATINWHWTPLFMTECSKTPLSKLRYRVNPRQGEQTMIIFLAIFPSHERVPWRSWRTILRCNRLQLYNKDEKRNIVLWGVALSERYNKRISNGPWPTKTIHWLTILWVDNLALLQSLVDGEFWKVFTENFSHKPVLKQFRWLGNLSDFR